MRIVGAVLVSYDGASTVRKLELPTGKVAQAAFVLGTAGDPVVLAVYEAQEGGEPHGHCFRWRVRDSVSSLVKPSRWGMVRGGTTIRSTRVRSIGVMS